MATATLRLETVFSKEDVHAVDRVFYESDIQNRQIPLERQIKKALGLIDNEDDTNVLTRIKEDVEGWFCKEIIESPLAYEDEIVSAARKRLEEIIDVDLLDITVEKCHKLLFKDLPKRYHKRLHAKVYSKLNKLLKSLLEKATTLEDYAFVYQYAPHDMFMTPCQENGGVCPSTEEELLASDSWKKTEHEHYNSIHNKARDSIKSLLTIELMAADTLEKLCKLRCKKIVSSSFTNANSFIGEGIEGKVKPILKSELVKANTIEGCKEVLALAEKYSYKCYISNEVFTKIIMLATEVAECDYVLTCTSSHHDSKIQEEAKKKKGFLLLLDLAKAETVEDCKLAFKAAVPHSPEAAACFRHTAILLRNQKATR